MSGYPVLPLKSARFGLGTGAGTEILPGKFTEIKYPFIFKHPYGFFSADNSCFCRHVPDHVKRDHSVKRSIRKRQVTDVSNGDIPAHGYFDL